MLHTIACGIYRTFPGAWRDMIHELWYIIIISIIQYIYYLFNSVYVHYTQNKYVMNQWQTSCTKSNYSNHSLPQEVKQEKHLIKLV